MTEKRVLCFGDSNTWGFSPATGERFDRSTRWTGRLAALLGSDYEVVSEGLNGRCATGPDPVMRLNAAYDDLTVALRTHKPIEHVVLMLGTNDFKRRFALTEHDIAMGLAHLAQQVLTAEELVGEKPNRLMLVAPLAIRLDGALDPSQIERRTTDFADAVGVSERLPELIKSIADEKGCAFINPNDRLKASERDAIHWDAPTHAEFSEIVAAKISS